MGEPPEGRRGFRPDVQGLRAIAVSAVVAYHLWPTRLPGGFVGVDVFYAISGYLITGQLAREAADSGRIALTRFWARRIRRLLPAAATVLGASLALLLLGLPRVTWSENLLEIRASALYVENWLLARHAVDYLASSDSASLVQHYWSLSVEEQFYVVWPVLLLGAIVAARRSGRLQPRTVAAVVLGIVFVSSFAYSVRAASTDPHAAFFATTTRGWEFAVGGAVALFGRPPAHGTTGWSRPLRAWLGLVLLLASLFVIHPGDAFPGWIAALPVAGAGLMLGSGSGRVGWSPTRFLRNRPVQWLGDASYSLYLWHWPLIVAAPWLVPELGSAVRKLLTLALSVVLAGLTKRFVEDPIRFHRGLRVRRWPAYAFAAAATAIVAGLAATASGQVQPTGRVAARRAVERAQAFERPAAPPRRATHAAAAAPVSCYGAAAMVNRPSCPRAFDRPPGLDTAFAAQDGRTYDCLTPADTSTVRLCDFGQVRGAHTTVAIVGNSHARRLVPTLDTYGRQHGWRVVVATKINCMGLISVPVGSENRNDPCLVWSQHVLRDLLAIPHLDAVIFASHLGGIHFLTGSWSPSARDLDTAKRDILATWSSFTRRGVRVIVAEDVPGVRPNFDPDCIARSTARTDPCAVSRASAVRSNVVVRLARQHPELVSYLPLHQYFCDATRCHGLIGGLVVYWDSNHLTATFARSLAPFVGPQIEAVLPRRGG